MFKYVAGLNPTNPASVFTLRITPVPGQPAQKNLVYDPVVTGRVYTVQSSTNLISGGYSNLPTIGMLQTNGTQVTATDTNATQAYKFYRVDIALPSGP